jgi:hypothetical protein
MGIARRFAYGGGYITEMVAQLDVGEVCALRALSGLCAIKVGLGVLAPEFVALRGIICIRKRLAGARLAMRRGRQSKKPAVTETAGLMAADTTSRQPAL